MRLYSIGTLETARRCPRAQRALRTTGYAVFLGVLLGGTRAQAQPQPPRPQKSVGRYVNLAQVAYYYYGEDARVEVFFVGGGHVSVSKAWWTRNMPPDPDAEPAPAKPAPSAAPTPGGIRDELAQPPSPTAPVYRAPSAAAPAPAPGGSPDDLAQPRAPEKVAPVAQAPPFVMCGRYFIGDNAWALSYVGDSKRYVFFDGTDKFLVLEGKEAEDFRRFVESAMHGRRWVWSGWASTLFRQFDREGGAMYLNDRCVTHALQEPSGEWSVHLTGKQSVLLDALEFAAAPAAPALAPQAPPPPPR